LQRKLEVNSRLAGGIYPKIVDDGPNVPLENTRTIKLSLVSSIAPELKELGRLTNASIAHVYVEGIRTPHTIVLFRELYESPYRPVMDNFDPQNSLPQYFKTQGIEIKDFLLWVYSANDLDQIGKVLENIDIAEVMFLRSTDGKLVAYTIRSGWQTFKPLRRNYQIHPAIRDFFHFIRRKPTKITPTTREEIEVISRGFKNAFLNLSNNSIGYV